MSQATPILAVDEYAVAAAIGLSVHWVRKDRRGARVLPFYRLNGAVRYDLGRVREALIAREEGGHRARQKA